MRFRYVGEAPNGSIDHFGVRFTPGEVAEITDAAAIKKTLANSFFVPVDGDAPDVPDQPAPKRRGRPPKVKTDGEDQEPIG